MKNIIVLAGSALSDAASAVLRKSGFTVEVMPPFNVLPIPVSTHPDMLLCVAGDYVICSARYADQHGLLFQCLCNASGKRLLADPEPIEAGYPKETRFNALITDSAVFCRALSVSPFIRDYADKNRLSVFNVRQGYTACSTAYFRGAIISADEGIVLSAASAGFDTLKIRPGFISCPGYDCGFIGGASGYYEGKLYFNGCLSLHPDCERIISFASAHDTECVSLSEGALTDCGGLVFLG